MRAAEEIINASLEIPFALAFSKISSGLSFVINRNLASGIFFITNDNPNNILQKASAKGISKEACIISSSPRKKVPTYLALSDWAIFFIQPLFSKAGSSPTKQGEIMGMEIPLICNSGVGDEIINASFAIPFAIAF